jgi:hypothetical protein
VQSFIVAFCYSVALSISSGSNMSTWETTEAIKDRRLFYEARSRVEYTAKHLGHLAAIAPSLLIVIFELPILLIYATTTTSLSPREGLLVIRGTALLWQNLIRLWRSLGAKGHETKPSVLVLSRYKHLGPSSRVRH